MEVVYPCCCGLDVHKKSITACVLWAEAKGKSRKIADLLQHGLLRGSFVPPQPIRELRDLTRYRVSLVQEINRIANRIQKVLEDANNLPIEFAYAVYGVLGSSRPNSGRIVGCP